MSLFLTGTKSNQSANTRSATSGTSRYPFVICLKTLSTAHFDVFVHQYYDHVSVVKCNSYYHISDNPLLFSFFSFFNYVSLLQQSSLKQVLPGNR